MENLREQSAIVSLTDKNRSFFSWLVRPLVLVLWPRRSSWVVRNLANIISTLRLPLSLAVVATLVYPGYEDNQSSRLYIGLGLMLILLISDGIDGALARGLMCVSRYGKAIDPLADKVFYLSGAATLVLGAHSIIQNEVVYGMLIVLLPALYFEMRLVMIAITTERECQIRQAAEPVGANNWGKTKFGLQALAVFIGLGLPWPTLGFSLAMSLVALSLPLAHFSLRGHQLDLEAIRLKPLI